MTQTIALMALRKWAWATAKNSEPISRTAGTGAIDRAKVPRKMPNEVAANRQSGPPAANNGSKPASGNGVG